MALYQVNAGDRILAADINQFYQILKGVAASGEAVTLIYNNQSLIFQPSSDPSAGTRVVLIKNTAGTVLATWRYDGLMELLSAAAAPASAIAGSIYWDSLLSALRVNDGTNWQSIDAYAAPQWTWTWLPGLTIQSDLTGTGTFANPSASKDSLVTLATGATSGSLSGIRKQMRVGGVSGANGVSRVRRWEFSFYSDIDANTNVFVFLTDEDAATAPSLTARHLGIKQVGAVVSFSTADNTTEQTTDVSAFFTTQTVRLCVVTYDGTTARLYVDGTLRATHATNVPGASAGTNPELHATIANTAASSKQLQIGPTSARMAF